MHTTLCNAATSKPRYLPSSDARTTAKSLHLNAEALFTVSLRNGDDRACLALTVYIAVVKNAFV